MEDKNLQKILRHKRRLQVIGAHDGMGGMLGERAGFDAIWASGFEISASHGLPDANILDMQDQLSASCKINDAVSIPVIADCDNGYGNAVNAAHAAKKFWRAGIAGICLEDNIFPKRCSFYGGAQRELVSAREHALKISAAKDATGGDLFVIGRTEAFIAGYELADALELRRGLCRSRGRCGPYPFQRAHAQAAHRFRGTVATRHTIGRGAHHVRYYSCQRTP